MIPYLGDFKAGSLVRHYWDTFVSAGGSVARTTAGTLRVYKDSSTTQRTSSSGVTDTAEFDGVTGSQLTSVDTSDNADAGFFAAGHDYAVMLVGAVIDGQTVNKWLFCFSIENRNPPVDVTKWSGTAVGTPDTAGYPKVTIKDGTGTGELDTSAGKVLLADGAITASVIATDAIDADAIADGAINAGALAADAITAAKIADGAITAAKIATDAIDADALATDVEVLIRTAVGLAAADLDDQLGEILAGSGGADGQIAVSYRIPFVLRTESTWVGGRITVPAGTVLDLLLYFQDADGKPIDLTGWDVTIQATNADTGLAVSEVAATVEHGRGGEVTLSMDPDWTAAAGRFYLTGKATLADSVLITGRTPLIVRSV